MDIVILMEASLNFSITLTTSQRKLPYDEIHRVDIQILSTAAAD